MRKATGYSFSLDLLLRIAAEFEGILSDTPCAVFMVHPGSSSVAEAAEAFESQLDLSYFRSVSGAIDGAFERNILSRGDAAQMKSIFSTTTWRVFFQGALGLLARGHLDSAMHLRDSNGTIQAAALGGIHPCGGPRKQTWLLAAHVCEKYEGSAKGMGCTRPSKPIRGLFWSGKGPNAAIG